MLEFIVLGQVPGTQIQLSFGAIIVLWLSCIGLVIFTVSVRKYRFAVKTEMNLLRIYLMIRLRK